MPVDFNDRAVSRSSGPSLRASLSLALLCSSTLVRCDCEDAPTFSAGAVYDPASQLSFGSVNVASEKTMAISVTSNGTAGLTIIDQLVTGDDDGVFTVTVEDDLLGALTLGQTSTVTVTYRPCPAAWSGNQLNESYDLTQCPGADVAATLQIVDNTPDGGTSILLTGEPVQPPQASFACVANPGSCNMPNATLSSPCNILQFGDLQSGDSACELYLEVTNSNRAGAKVAPLTISNAEILLREASSNELVSTEDAGFSLLDASGAELTFPQVIEVEEGASSATTRYTVRFSGQRPGGFIGTVTNDLGLRLYVDDPDVARGVKTIGVIANATAPDIASTPAVVDFGDVDQNVTATATVTVRNDGNAPLSITSAGLRPPGNSEFAFRTDDSMALAPRTVPGPGSFTVYVDYTPSNDGTDREYLDFQSDDPDEPTFSVELRGGPTPAVCDPPTTIDFPIASDGSTAPVERDLVLGSCGSGNLMITEIDLQNSGNPESLDDFAVEGCTSFPCTINETLCPQRNPTCTIGGAMPGVNFTRKITYDNNDISTLDYANLVVRTNDPSRSEITVVLSAQDNPCLPPSNLSVTVNTDPVCANRQVSIAINGSAGGPVGGNATFASCDYQMLFGSIQTFTPDDTLGACTMTQFLPTASGFHLVTAEVTNSCGAKATVPQEQISVSGGCN